MARNSAATGVFQTVSVQRSNPTNETIESLGKTTDTSDQNRARIGVEQVRTCSRCARIEIILSRIPLTQNKPVFQFLHQLDDIGYGMNRDVDEWTEGNLKY